VIDLCYRDRKSDPNDPLSFDAFIAAVARRGLKFRRVEQATIDTVCVLFGSLEDGVVARLPAEVRNKVVVVAEGGTPAAIDAASTRDSLGLLGLVEPRAWNSLQRGLYVTWGLYGRRDVADAAGLVPSPSEGLQPLGEPEALPDLLARFLIAAEAG
jgi:hypothetical protein